MTEHTLPDWFAASADRHPDAVALRVRDTAWTYRELREASERLANVLAPARPQRVGLLAARDPLTYIGYLAIQRAGAAVVPLNPLYPPDRNDTICRDAGVSLVVAANSGGGALSSRGPRFVELADARPGTPSRSLLPRLDDEAYVLFTSGSTGTPKGLPIRHGNVSPYVAYTIDRYEVGPGCRLSQTFDLTFDPSVFDMFTAWGSGATLVVPQREELGDPVKFVRDNQITHWFSVPSVVSLAARLRRLPAGAMPGLRWSLFAGEQLTADQAAAWASAAPGSVLENLYGPTELTVTCTSYRLPRDRSAWPETSNGTIPIGTCYPHLEHVVLDEDGKPAPEGELCVRGRQRFRGYLDEANNIGRFTAFDPDSGEAAEPYAGDHVLTADHWYRTGDRIRTGEDGSMLHLGRLDSQVQIHGYRVELGEIEAVLRRHPGVSEAVVLPYDGELRAVYSGEEVGSRQLSDWLDAALPAYMVPRDYAFVAEFPLNRNGKLDRKKLEELPC